jgi:multiple sugar transport system substrate-binding protein
MKRMPGLSVLIFLMLMLAACGGGGQAGPPGAADSGPPGAADAGQPTAVDAGPPGAADAGQPTALAAEAVSGDTGDPNTISVWSYLAPDDPSVQAYIERFQQQNPTITIKYTAFPEDDYQDKVRTALAAHSPPDVAVIEDRAWMKAGLVEELSDEYKQWGVDPKDFNSGGMARVAPEGDISAGIYGVGDFLGGNVIFYNKDLFDQAGVAHPSPDKSLTIQEYDQICRKLAKPDPDPTKTVYGCSMPFWGFDIWSRWAWGPDGKQALGNMNSPAMIESWNIGTKLVRDKIAPSVSILETVPAGESDLFATGKLGMTWSDFTEATKYKENNINFGLMPFYVLQGSEAFVDTWTTPWGTFKESKRKEAALKFLQFLATDGQLIRLETSSDPPLSTKVAQEHNYGKDDPIKQEYLRVLQQAKPQVFVPPLPEGIWDREEVYRKLTTGGATDAQAILDEEAQKTQPALDKAWQEWEKLGQSQ